MSQEVSALVRNTSTVESDKIDTVSDVPGDTEQTKVNNALDVSADCESVKESIINGISTNSENALPDVTDVKTELDLKLKESACEDNSSEDVTNIEEKTMETESIPFTEIKVKDKENSSDTLHKMVDPLAYRDDRDGAESEDDTCDDSDDSSSSSSSSSDPELENKKESLSEREDEDEEKPGKKKKASGSIRTRGELYPEELPPLEELKISVDEAVEMQEVGKVSSTVGVLVVIQANKDVPALNEDTVLFTENREAFGKIFEVFGPVSSPFYSVRFNSPEDITDKNITPGLTLYCAPKEQDYTQFVFVEQLKKIKGSDASWENNNEPPSSCIDFSDDEDEKRMKAKNRNKPQEEGTTDNEASNKKGRNRKRHQRFEKKMGSNQEHSRDNFNQKNQSGGRGRQWPPKQMDSWPPRDSSGWPSRPQETWQSAGQGDGSWQYGPNSQTSHRNISPGRFPGGRGMSRQSGASPRFHNPFQQIQSRGGPGRGPHGPPQHSVHSFRGGPHPGPPEGYPQEAMYNMAGNYHGSNSNIIMDTRLVQNPNHNVDTPPFGMTRPLHSRSTFGGQPQFTPGPMGGQYNQRPGTPGMGIFHNGPPGRW